MLSQQDFTYASPEQSRVRRALIRGVETVTGRPRLQRMYFEHRHRPLPEESFWEAAVRRLELVLRYDEAALRAIPATGPLVVVANHPFGVLDGIVIGYLVSRLRDDFQILTHSLLYRAEEIRPHLLPIDFSESRDALQTNLTTRAEARRLVAGGGALVVFPGGAVSTAPSLLGRAEDPAWKPFAAELALRWRASVVPLFFEGQNSRLFQVASQFSQTLRLSLLFQEVVRRIGSEVAVRIGAPLPPETLARQGGKAALIDHLHKLTYGLGRDEPGFPAASGSSLRGTALG